MYRCVGPAPDCSAGPEAAVLLLLWTERGAEAEATSASERSDRAEGESMVE